MSTHNICFRGEIRKISAFFRWKKRFICCYVDPNCLSSSFWLIDLRWAFMAQSTHCGLVEPVRLPDHTFPGHDYLSGKPLFVHIFLPGTDNSYCPSWISGRERMTNENISWSISMKECCRKQQGSNPWPPDHKLDTHPTEPQRQAICELVSTMWIK